MSERTFVFNYALIVDWTGDECTAYLDNRDSPFRGYGKSPTEALSSLMHVIVEWRNGGSERWLDTPSGTKLARMFVPGFEPGSGGSAGN